MKKSTIRLEDDMHRALAERAKAEHRSLHSLFVYALAEYLRRTTPSRD